MPSERDLLARLADAAWPILGAERVWLEEDGDRVALVRVPATQWMAFVDATAHASTWRASPEGAGMIYTQEEASHEPDPAHPTAPCLEAVAEWDGAWGGEAPPHQCPGTVGGQAETGVASVGAAVRAGG